MMWLRCVIRCCLMTSSQEGRTRLLQVLLLSLLAALPISWADAGQSLPTPRGVCTLLMKTAVGTRGLATLWYSCHVKGRADIGAALIAVSFVGC